MLWLISAVRQLRERGVLGINRRNAACILDHNPRSRFPIVDDKLRMAELCRSIGVPTPSVHAIIDSYATLGRLPVLLADHSDFIVKPARGSAGRGILAIIGRAGDAFRRHNGDLVSLDALRQHLSSILSGMYSLGAQPDRALIQQRVRLHPEFAAVADCGIPDVRVVLYRNEPAMAMLRLPTKESGGRANLHQGGIGVGIDLDSGVTHHAVQRNRAVTHHPDTARPLVGLPVPCWPQVLEMSRRVARAVGLGYIGVDIVLDAVAGPLLLEANARPGLAIQIANGEGLVHRLQAIDDRLSAKTHKPPRAPMPARRASVPARRAPVEHAEQV